jgi:hypothetical protein
LPTLPEKPKVQKRGGEEEVILCLQGEPAMWPVVAIMVVRAILKPLDR